MAQTKVSPNVKTSSPLSGTGDSSNPISIDVDALKQQIGSGGLTAVSVNSPLSGRGTQDNPLSLSIDSDAFRVSGGSLTLANSSSGSLSAWPVGSIYYSMKDTSPASLIGGSWSKLNGARFIVTSGSHIGQESSLASAGDTGGSWIDVVNTQGWLTTSLDIDSGGVQKWHGAPNKGSATWNSDAQFNSQSVNWVGTYGNKNGMEVVGTLTVNTVPQYLAVNAWQRTA